MVQGYDPMRLFHVAGMILVTEDGIFDGPRPQDAFSKAMDYKLELALYYTEVKSIVTEYLSNLSEKDKEFFIENSGLYSGSPNVVSEEDSDKNMEIMHSLAKTEKEKGLLRKLTK